MEPLMQPLGAWDFYLNILCAVLMPCIIVANLTKRVRSNPSNAYLWRENPAFMWTSLAIIGLLALWSMMQLAGHYGLVSAAVVEMTTVIWGIPFLILTVALFWFGGRMLRGYLRRARKES